MNAILRGQIFDRDTPKTIKLCLSIVNAGTVYQQREKTAEDHPMAIRISRKLGRYNRIDGIRTNWAGSLAALVYVSKHVYAETIIFLYQNTTFVFDSPHRIQDFATIVPKKSLSTITKLLLHYTPYGPSHDRFEQLHVASWSRACLTLSQNLVHLQNLEIWIQSARTPSDSIRHPYLKPLFQFRRLALRRQLLTLVRVHFWTRWLKLETSMTGLRDANHELHQLYGDAIARVILGWSEKDALAELKAAWQRHVRWHHHLNFLPTEW